MKAFDEAVQPEFVIEAHILRFLFYLKPKGIEAWKHEEHGRYDVKSERFKSSRSVFHRTGLSDIQGTMKLGRWLAIEVKTPKVKKFIDENWEKLKTYVGKNKAWTRYRKQIDFVEMINFRGGLAFFASSVDEVELRLKQEGII